MQRKNVLVGGLYNHKGSALVRVLSADASPVQGEAYDFIQQKWIKLERGAEPRDMDPITLNAPEIIEAGRQVNEAAKRRLQLACIAAFNAKYGVYASLSATATETGRYRIKDEDSNVVTLAGVDFAHVTQATVEAPIDTDVKIRAAAFVRWFLGPLGNEVPATDEIQGHPLLTDEQLDAVYLARVQQRLDTANDRYKRAYAIKKDVRDALREEIQNDESLAHLRGRSIYSTREEQHPQYQERLDKALFEAGLTPADLTAPGRRIDDDPHLFL